MSPRTVFRSAIQESVSIFRGFKAISKLPKELEELKKTIAILDALLRICFVEELESGGDLVRALNWA